LSEISPSLLDYRFLALLTAIILVRRLIPSHRFALYGAVSSGLLIGLASFPSLIAIGGTTLLYLYPVHLWMNRLRNQPQRLRLRRTVFIASTTGLVAFMVGFKIYQHFTIPFLGDTILDKQLQQLVGFSYFLFRAINFLYMQYLVAVQLTSPAPLLFYTLFPPTLTCGPIHKFLDFQQQLGDPRMPQRQNYAAGIYRITRGFFRKICLAYLFNIIVLKLLGAAAPDILHSLGIIVFLYLYFYVDFAGYSDIAIGFGGMMGVRVPENFKQPLLASTLTEFWRNWHITLVEWLRDHVFIPLGGMRSGRTRTSFLALLVMVICGLWHGLTIYYLIWGLWHGLHLLLEAQLGIKPTPVSRRGSMRYWLKVGWTNLRVALGAILFLPNATNIMFVLRGFVP
jgi:alginate O-acetyltransferase complex protein AlgI